MGDIKLEGAQGDLPFLPLPGELGLLKGKGEAQDKKTVDKQDAKALEKLNEAKALEKRDVSREVDVLSVRDVEDVRDIPQEDPPADLPSPPLPDALKTEGGSPIKLSQTASFSKISPLSIAMVLYTEIRRLNTQNWTTEAKYGLKNREEYMLFKLASIAATYLAGLDKAAGQMTQAIGQAASGLISLREVKVMASNVGKAQEDFTKEKSEVLKKYNKLADKPVDKDGNELVIQGDNPDQPVPLPKVLNELEKAELEASKKALAEMNVNEAGKKREIQMPLDQQNQAVSRALTSLVQAATSATESGFTVAQTEKERQAGLLETEAKLRESLWQNAQQAADKDKQERDKDNDTFKNYIQAESRATSYGTQG